MKHNRFILKISAFFFIAIVGIESNISANTLLAENLPPKNLQDPAIRSQLRAMKSNNKKVLSTLKSRTEEVDSAELQQSLENTLQATNALFEKNNISEIDYCKIRPKPPVARNPKHTSTHTEYPRR